VQNANGLMRPTIPANFAPDRCRYQSQPLLQAADEIGEAEEAVAF
jgi:hypothetical protein